MAAITTSAIPDTSTNGGSSDVLIGKAGVCSIDVQYVDFNWRQPWQRLAQNAASGTGFCIDGHRILTNAHVVNAAVDVRVRLLGSAKKFKANVWIYAADCDLAILTLDDSNEENSFFYDKSTGAPIALQLSDVLPNLQERVHVAGYPTGGKTICVTEGVVSRIDVRTVSVDSRVKALCIQIDAAINSGNSGGPVFDNSGKVTGVAFQKVAEKGSDNIGYIIAASTVRAFLSRCDHEQGIYTMAPSAPYRYSRLFNRSMRLAHNVPDHIQGVLINAVCDTAVKGQLKKGDVLTQIDGYNVESDGQTYLRGDELIQHDFVFAAKKRHEPVRFTVFRDGNIVECEPIVMTHIPNLFTLYPEVDHLAEYLFIGPALFVPASYGLIYQGSEPDSILRGTIKKDAYLWPHEWPQGTEQQLVLLIKIMAHDASFDYKRSWSLVTKYNGTPVQSLKHLRDLWQATRDEAEKYKNDGDKDTNELKAGDDGNTEKEKYQFARIDFDCNEELIFEVQTAIQAERDVLAAHNIPKACVILPPNPKYRWE